MAERPPRVCVVGSSNIDLLFRTATVPRAGETLQGESFQLGYGGKGANQAVMAARLGAHVSMVTKLGRDPFGTGTLENYRTQGIETAHVLFDDKLSSGTAMILVEPDGQNRILIVPGANLALTVDEVAAARPVLAAADVLLCQLEISLDATVAALKLARELGVRTIFNPAPVVPLPPDLLPLCDVCIPNETELERLTGSAVDSVAAITTAAQQLRKQGPQIVIVTLGARGVLVVEADQTTHVPSVPVTAVDTTGAGDAFVGSFAVAWSRGQTAVAAARQGVALAAFSVTRSGTQTSFPTRGEAESWLQQQGALAPIL